MRKDTFAAGIRKLAGEFWPRIATIEFMLYLVKCLSGASLCFGLYLLFPGYEFSWSIVSVLLVLAPDYENSVALSMGRIKANFIGALVGLGAFLIHPPNLLTLCVSILVTILVCTFLRLGSATRTALAALIIVLIRERESNNWQLGTQRMVAVAVGSLVGLGLTVLVSRILRAKRRSPEHPSA